MNVISSAPATLESTPCGDEAPLRPPAGTGTGGFRLLWAASILVPFLIFGLAAHESWTGVERETRIRLEHIVDILHEHALRSFETQEAILEAVDQRIRGLSPAEVASSPAIEQFLSGLARRARPSSGVMVVGADGKVLAGSPSTGRPADVSMHDFVRDRPLADTVTFLGEVTSLTAEHELVFTMSRRSQEGYLVVSTFKLSYFEAFYASIAETAEDVVLLTRGDGALLARVPVLTDPAGYALRFHRPEFDEAMEKRRLFAPAAPSPVDGRARYYAARRIGPYPVLISYGLSASVVQVAWLRRVTVLAAVCAVAALLFMAFTLQTQRSIGREHRALAAASAEAKRRIEAETRLHHAQRVEALGRIASGVAHDINNLVAAVTASAQLLDRRAEEPSEVRRIAGLIKAAAERGARLTGRIKGFARRDDRMTDTADIAEAVEAAMDLLKDTLGASYKLQLEVSRPLPAGQCDRAEFETVLVNLVINARDAMPGGGTITIAAGAETAPSVAGAAAGLPPGRYVRIAVGDHGVGMDAETLARIGEAFFTTKGSNGTGLGLALARAFAHRAGGTLRLDSEPGRGTTVTILIAAAGEPHAAEPLAAL
jgi:two-component system NtrC family sensor kinase